MHRLTKKRRAISAVITTMIILIASVVLGSGVTLYGTSLFQTQGQSESIATTGTQLWVDKTYNLGYAWGAAEIRNSGDKLLALDTISVRGTQVPYSNWYYDTNPTRITLTNFQSQLIYPGVNPNGQLQNSIGTGLACIPATLLMINEFGTNANPTLCLTQSTGPISLEPGDKVIVYFRIPNGVMTAIDAGYATSVAIYADHAGSPVSVTIQGK